MRAGAKRRAVLTSRAPSFLATLRMLGTAAARPLQREWSRSREPTTRSTPRFVMPQQPSFPLPQAQRRPPVAKTVTTGPVLVFVAGVEGTGHHMLCAALTPRHPHCRTEPCFKVDKRLDALVRHAPMPQCTMRAPTTPMCQCANADTRPRLYSERRVARRSRGGDRAAARLPPATERARQRLASADDDAVHGHARLGSRFKTLVPRRHAVPRARLRESAARVLHGHAACAQQTARAHVHARVHVQANAPCILSSGQEGKATAHADVALLAELAEEAGVDLRVVTLTRELASTARSRMQPNATGAAARTALAANDRWRTEPARNSNGGGASLEAARWRAALRWPPGGSLSRRPFESQARILADQECLLASQLRQLDRRFYHVLPYEAVSDTPRLGAGFG